MQLEFFDVPSPCIGVCQTDDKGLCRGCFRTRDERQQWLNYDSDVKQKVIKRCIQRRKRKENGVKPKVVEQPVENFQPSLLDPPKVDKVENSTDLDFGDFEL